MRVVYVSDDDRLIQPTLPTLRDDKRPDECTIDQMATARTNKNLLTTWRTAA